MRLYLTTLYVNNDKRHCFAYYIFYLSFYCTCIIYLLSMYISLFRRIRIYEEIGFYLGLPPPHVTEQSDIGAISQL